MKYNGVIQRKFALLDKQLVRLQNHTKDVSFDTFKDDWVMRSMTERVLQVMVEIVIDVAERIIAIENAGPVASAAEAIGILNNAEPVYCFESLKGKLLFNKDTEKYLRFFSLTCRQYESQLADYQRQHKYRLEAKKNC